MNLPTEQTGSNGRFYKYVIDNIRQMITDGELQTGQELSSERELTKKFNVNHIPVREALKVLGYMEVLDNSPGDGAYVKNTSAQGLISKTDFSFDAMADTIRDLLELRIVLEAFTAYHATQRRTNEDIASVQKLLRDIREARKINGGTEESVQNLHKLSRGFHQTLVRATHSAVLSSVYKYLYELLDIFRQFTINNGNISYGSIVAHEVLFGKVIEGGAEGARQCMEEHMKNVHYNLRSTVGTDHPGQKVAIG